MRSRPSEKQNKQEQTPLIEAVSRFQLEDPAYFRIPGHRFANGADEKALELLGEKAFSADLTEAEGLDDLHHPEGAILRAQLLAAELFGADRTWFLVNGTTCGNETMILSAVGEGDKILVPRNAHKSVLMGLVLSGAEPVWVSPEYVSDFGIGGSLSPAAVEKRLEEEPECRAVFAVSPTYEGVCSDLKSIAEIAHKRNIPLLVDEAHGSHLYFSDLLPEGAIASGADMCSQSTHKTIGSLTQSSMLHLKSRLIDPDRVDKCLKLVMSTSPSYLLMASLDGARHQLAVNGHSLIRHAAELAEYVRSGLRRIENADILERGEGIFAHDPLRVVFSLKRAGLSGFRLQDLLYDRYRVSTELADMFNVTAVMTWGNNRADADRLIRAAEELAKDAEEVKEKIPQTGISFLPLPPVCIRPRQAFFSEKETVFWEEACGRIAGESIILYPPGIPLVNPGERITKEVYETACEYRRKGLHLHGPADPGLNVFQVISE